MKKILMMILICLASSQLYCSQGPESESKSVGESLEALSRSDGKEAAKALELAKRF